LIEESQADAKVSALQ